MDESINNDERRRCRRSSFGCHGLCGHWLARADGREGNTQGTTTNDDIVVVRRLAATSLSATWHLQTPPHPSSSVVTWRWSFLLWSLWG